MLVYTTVQMYNIPITSERKGPHCPFPHSTDLPLPEEKHVVIYIIISSVLPILALHVNAIIHLIFCLASLAQEWFWNSTILLHVISLIFSAEY